MFDTFTRYVTLEDDAITVDGIGTYCASTGKLLTLRTETPIFEPSRPDQPYGRRAQIGTKSREIDLEALALVFGPEYQTWKQLDRARLADAIENALLMEMEQ
jgi:hypothetical protein